MSDQDSGPLPELTSEQEATVRRLLAAARHDDPIPADVGDRLDRLLADLSSSSSAPAAPVVDLAARRRRRNAGGLLVAAAAVIVGGVVVGQMVDVRGGGSDDDAGSAADTSVSRNSSDGQDDSAEAEAGGGSQPAPDALAAAEPLELSSQNLERDVQRQLKRSSASANLDPGAATLSPPYDINFTCAPAPVAVYGAGKFFAAFYDGIPTVLALRPAEGDTQEAQVLECGTGTPLQSVTVPAP